MAAGANTMALRRGIDKAVARAERDQAPLQTSQRRRYRAGRRCLRQRDAAIGGIIAEAMEKVGKDGVITVEESQTMETSLEFAEGMRLDRGYLRSYFVTDPERMEVALDHPLILLYEKKINSMYELMPLLEQPLRSASHC
ncbi:MAG: hypothetical protein J2P21_22495 [Chloracidobacterium sp.]|nr:hypothetical protein [Chloracidobacterium sp.]